MTQTNRSLRTNQHRRFSRSAAVFPILFLLAGFLAACNTTTGAGGSVGSTSTGAMVGIGISAGPDSTLIVYRDELFNGPSAVRISHRKALKALREGDYATAAALFEATLKNYPAHPDATYYLGLTRIYQSRREAGFKLLKSYRDPDHFRITKWVQKMAEFMEEKEDITSETVHRTLNRYRTDAFNQELRDTRDMNVWD